MNPIREVSSGHVHIEVLEVMLTLIISTRFTA